jgi:hypothetical protein
MGPPDQPPPEPAEPSGAWLVAFAVVRRVVVFLLGVAVFLEGLSDHDATELVVGMVMVGVLPVDDVLRRWRPRH